MSDTTRLIEGLLEKTKHSIIDSVRSNAGQLAVALAMAEKNEIEKERNEILKEVLKTKALL